MSDSRRTEPCAGCGRMFDVCELDAKPSVQGDENSDWERFECVDCYGPDWVPGPSLQERGIYSREQWLKVRPKRS